MLALWKKNFCMTLYLPLVLIHADDDVGEVVQLCGIMQHLLSLLTHHG